MGLCPIPHFIRLQEVGVISVWFIHNCINSWEIGSFVNVCFNFFTTFNHIFKLCLIVYVIGYLFFPYSGCIYDTPFEVNIALGWLPAITNNSSLWISLNWTSHRNNSMNDEECSECKVEASMEILSIYCNIHLNLFWCCAISKIPSWCFTGDMVFITLIKGILDHLCLRVHDFTICRRESACIVWILSQSVERIRFEVSLHKDICWFISRGFILRNLRIFWLFIIV